MSPRVFVFLNDYPTTGYHLRVTTCVLVFWMITPQLVTILVSPRVFLFLNDYPATGYQNTGWIIVLFRLSTVTDFDMKFIQYFIGKTIYFFKIEKKLANFKLSVAHNNSMQSTPYGHNFVVAIWRNNHIISKLCNILFLNNILASVIFPSWRHGMETISASLALERGIHWSLGDSPHIGPVM